MQARTLTYWDFVYQVDGQRHFSDEVRKVLNWLQREKSAFLRDLQQSGGTVCLDVNILGSVNIGDELHPRDLLQMAELGITLGIEVFPKMNSMPWPASGCPWRIDPDDVQGQSVN